MARFRFNLEHVLEMRKREERDAQVRYAEVDRERVALESQLRGHQRSIVGIKRDLRSALAGDRSRSEEGLAPVTLPDVRMQAGASLLVMGRAQSAVLELAGVHKRLDQARSALLEAVRARKAVETLRERRFEAWKREQDKKESAELDDIATMRTGRATW